MLKRKSYGLPLGLLCFFFMLSSCATTPKEIPGKQTSQGYPVIIMLSGSDGRMNYLQFSSELQRLGYYVHLLDSNDLPLRNLNDCKAKLLEEIKKAVKDSGAVSQKAVVIGYSLGGWVALYAASTMPESVSQVVAYYPATIRMTDSLPRFSDSFQVPVLVFQGEQDAFRNCCTVGRIRAIAATAKEKGKQFNLVVYPEAGHCFNVSGSTYFSFYSNYAEDSWRQTLETLKKYHR